MRAWIDHLEINRMTIDEELLDHWKVDTGFIRVWSTTLEFNRMNSEV